MKNLILLVKVALFATMIFLQFEEVSVLDRWFGKFGYYAEVISRFLVFVLGLDLLRIIWKKIYAGRTKSSVKRDNFVLGLSHIYNMLVIVAVIFTLFGFFQIDVRELFTSLSIIAAALAITFKEYITNVINGMIITFSDNLSLGDYVKIDENKGKIIDINLLNIHLLNDDDDLIFIPNNTVFSSTILNYTKQETKKISIDFEAGFRQFESVDGLERDLKQAVSAYKDRIVPDSFNLKVVEVGKDSVAMKFQYTLARHDKQLEKELRRIVLRHVVNLVKPKKESEA